MNKEATPTIVDQVLYGDHAAQILSFVFGGLSWVLEKASNLIQGSPNWIWMIVLMSLVVFTLLWLVLKSNSQSVKRGTQDRGGDDLEALNEELNRKLAAQGLEGLLEE